MLPAAHRLSDSDTFRAVVRKGHRAGSATVVVHLRIEPDADTRASPALVGFTVSKAVGDAVTRNRVRRRLRHLTREHLQSLEELPGRTALVVRALPASAEASYDELRADLARSLGRVMPS